MFPEYTVQLLPVGYYGSVPIEAQRSLLPVQPGIYIWTHDLGTVMHDARNPDFSAVLQERIKPTMHRDTVRVGHYRGVHLYDDPVELQPNTATRLARLQAAGVAYPRLLEWSLLCGSLWQRPLYVGRAMNLRGRLRTHLQQGSDATTAMQSAGINLNECLISMAVLTAPSPGSTDDEESDDFDDPDFLLADYPLPRQDVEDLISVAESLVIRQAHPLFNDKMT